LKEKERDISREREETNERVRVGRDFSWYESEIDPNVRRDGARSWSGVSIKRERDKGQEETKERMKDMPIGSLDEAGERRRLRLGDGHGNVETCSKVLANTDRVVGKAGKVRESIETVHRHDLGSNKLREIETL